MSTTPYQKVSKIPKGYNTVRKKKETQKKLEKDVKPQFQEEKVVILKAGF